MAGVVGTFTRDDEPLPPRGFGLSCGRWRAAGGRERGECHEGIGRFRDAQTTEGKTASTANLAVKILRAAFASARRLGLSLTNPAEGVSLREETDTEERNPFTLPQVGELMAAADDEWRGMILLGYRSGLQLNDAAQLTWENVDLAARTLIFRDAKTSRRKKGWKKDTTHLLHPDLVEYLGGLQACDDPLAPLFPSLHEAGERRRIEQRLQSADGKGGRPRADG